MVDVFGEVDEQLRADRLRAFFKTAVPVFIAAMVLSVLAVLGVWGVEKYRTSISDKASQTYNDAFEAAAKGDGPRAYDLFGQVAKDGGAYGALALMQQGSIRMGQGKQADAIPLFDKAAATTKNPLISDIATLKSVYLQLDTASLAQMSAKLTPLTAADRPFHVQAREALAMAKLAAGQTAAAKADLVALNLGADTPDSARQRVQAIIALIDSGTAKSLKTLEQQAKTAAPIQLAPPPQDPAAAAAAAAQQAQPEGQQ